MAPKQWEEDDHESSNDDSSSSTDDQDEFDQESPKRITKQLNMSRNYMRTWTSQNPFREFYQNWRDAIIETFNLKSAFKPEYKGDDRFIPVVVPYPKVNPPAYMGLIEFNKATGRVVLANASPTSRMEPKHLQLGNTSKDKKPDMAGSHGDGFKLAALVMSRDKYKVRIEASNYYWNFGFKAPLRKKFICTLNPSKKKPPSSSNIRQHLTPMPQFKNRIWKDVTVTIGSGRQPEARRVEQKEFTRWLGVTFDIQGFSTPTDMIETSAGDLILDSNFANKTYWKGLLLQTPASGINNYHYGYNFRHGQVNRDRVQLKSTQEEAKRLANLWQDAIEQREGNVLAKYVKMLRDRPGAPDIKHADDYVNQVTAKKIWKYLLSEAGGRKFYYWNTQDKDVRIITECLRKEPVGISEVLWNILRKGRLIRTPGEERIAQFRNAQPIPAPKSVFARTVQRMLKASLLLSEHTKGLDAVFVDCGHSDIDVLFEPNSKQFKIHKKWLDYHATHREYPCRVSASDRKEPDGYFYCGHIVERLYRRSIEELVSTESADPAIKKQWEKMFQIFHEKVDEMPRMVKIKPPSEASTTWALDVSWEFELPKSIRRRFRGNLQYKVVLHGEECVTQADQLLYREGNPCTCVQKVLEAGITSNKTIKFDNLSGSRKYFPMVARNEDESFYGIAPCPTEASAPGTGIHHFIIEDDTTNNATREDLNKNENGASHGNCRAGFWKTWNAEEFPKLFRMLSSYENYNPMYGPHVETLENARLNWRFERDDYVKVAITSADSSDRITCCLRIHVIYLPNQPGTDDEGSLLVTRYSFNHLNPIFDGYSEINEVYLESKGLDSMGQRQDASLVPI
ncbi:hypothetical protein PHISCL_05598 [Aspergillus sclerotialis]|uniref:Uncharacterized protein n=1 Tax=Aspergillus sclerotialis TaxID=2070753 RepID=A0A3A2ZYB1_9EURO|nr:hypothetical protein PHISCL_05598 [Aspergillus sclerotialis]